VGVLADRARTARHQLQAQAQARDRGPDPVNAAR
jgi:hypothetical protein